MAGNPFKLSAGLSIRMMLGTAYHGGFVLASPFYGFILLADDDIRVPASIVTFLLLIPILWFCTWDFVRLRLKRHEEPFYSVWMSVLLHTEPEEGGSPLTAPVKALFAIRLRGFLLGVAAGVEAAYAYPLFSDHGDYSDAPLPLFFIMGLAIWIFAERYWLMKLLEDKEKEDRKFAELMDLAARGNLKTPGASAKKSFRGAIRDFALWSWLIGSIWGILIFVVPGMIPRPLSAEARDFFDQPVHVARDDGIYAIDGLYAPLGTPDTVAWAKQEALKPFVAAHEKTLREMQETPSQTPEGAVMKDMPKIAGFNICTGKKRPDITRARSLQPAPMPTDMQGPPYTAWAQPCLYLDEWGAVLADNKEILARYENLFGYSDFERPINLPARNGGGLLMDLSRLEAVNYAYRAYTGDAEGALRAWLRNARFLKEILEAPANLSGYAINLTAYMALQKYLPAILQRQPALAAKYEGEIEATMDFLDPGRFDYLRIWRQEVRWDAYAMEHPGEAGDDTGTLPPWEVTLFLNPGLYKEALYVLEKEAEPVLAMKHPADMSAALQHIEEERDFDKDHMFHHLGDMGAMLQSIIVAEVVGGVSKGFTLFEIGWRQVNQQRTALVWVQAIAAGVEPSRMQEFLNSAARRDPRFIEVLSSEAFYWNDVSRGVCYFYRTPKTSYGGEQADMRCLDGARLIRNEGELK